MKKIAFITNYYDTFSNYQEIELINNLAKQANIIYVFTSNHTFKLFKGISKISLQERQINFDYENNIKVIRLKTWVNLSSIIILRGIVKKINLLKPDLIFIQPAGQLIGLNLLFSSYVRKNNKSVHITFQDNHYQYNKYNSLVANLKRFFFYLTKGMMYIPQIYLFGNVYNNTNNGIGIIDNLTFNKKIRLAPLGYDNLKFYFSENQRIEYRRKYNIDNNDKLICIVGKVTKIKKLEHVINVLESLEVKFKLIIAGFANTEYCKNFKEFIDTKHKIKDNIITLDFVNYSEMNKIFNACDFGIWYKQPAITIQQAMGTGLDIITPNNDTVDHLFNENFKNLHEFKNKDIESFSDKLDELLKKINYNSVNRKYNSIKFSESFSMLKIINKFYLNK